MPPIHPAALWALRLQERDGLEDDEFFTFERADTSSRSQRRCGRTFVVMASRPFPVGEPLARKWET